MKVVINRCYGGFGLSPTAIASLRDKGSRWVHSRDRKEYFSDTVLKDMSDITEEDYLRIMGLLADDTTIWSLEFNARDDRNFRADPEVIAVVESLGVQANGECAELSIVEIPDGIEWYIEEYDGLEHIAEEHRTWR